MPYAYASQFRSMVVEQVRSGKRVADVAGGRDSSPSVQTRAAATTCSAKETQSVATPASGIASRSARWAIATPSPVRRPNSSVM